MLKSDTSQNPRNDGKGVERLVKLIESSQLPDGFLVETRQQIFEDGACVAELDILITGKIGSATFRFLIECRDRPSEGPAPRSWIEQLIGRRQSLGLSKVMAVSSTGFAQGAKKLAEETDIELRHLQDFRYDDVAHWLPIMAPLLERHGEFNAVRLMVKTQIEANAGSQVHFKPDQPIFRHVASGKVVTLLDVWRQIIHEESTWREVPQNGTPRAVRVIVGTKLLQEYAVITEEGDVEIGVLEFDATLTASPSKMRMVQAASYLSQPVNAGEQEIFVEMGRWAGDEKDLVKEMIVLGYPKKGRQTDQ